MIKGLLVAYLIGVAYNTWYDMATNWHYEKRWMIILSGITWPLVPICVFIGWIRRLITYVKAIHN